MAFAISVLLAGAMSVSAAPAPPTAATIDKYLLDDTDFLIVVEVKPLLASPLVAKQHRKQIEELLKSEPVQVWLKNAGFDPLRDVERIILPMSRRWHGTDKDLQGAGPVVLVQGRFDAAKLKAKLAQLAKDSPQGVKVDAQEEIYRLAIPNGSSPFFFAQLDRNTLMVAGKKDLIAEAMEKAAGKKKTTLKSEAVREFLKKRKPEPALQMTADGSTFWQTMARSQVQNGARITTIQHTTLEDVGILRMRGGLSVAEKIKGGLTLKTKDADTAKQTAEIFRMGVKKVGDELEAKVKAIAQNRGENLERAKKRDLAPLRKAVDDTTIESDGSAVTLTTEIDREALATFLRIFFGIGIGG
jgi:hypothetical protein